MTAMTATPAAAAKGYLWAELDIADPERFEAEYSVAVRPLLAQYGARFVILDDAPVVLEGGRSVRRTLLVEFASRAAARAFYDDPAYQAIVPARQRWSTGHLYLLDGVPTEQA